MNFTILFSFINFKKVFINFIYKIKNYKYFLFQNINIMFF